MNDLKTILLVEDESTFRRTLAAFLEDSGYRVLQAANGREGLECVKREKPDAVLTDLRMPVMDGFELMAHLQQMNPAPPVIVITGTGEKQVEMAILKHGAKDCLFKPVNDLQALEKALEKALAST